MRVTSVDLSHAAGVGIKPGSMHSLGPLVVLAGCNGAGKSRILKALSQSLTSEHRRRVHRRIDAHVRNGLQGTPTLRQLMAAMPGDNAEDLTPFKLSVPASLASLVDDIHAFEGGDPTRTRYARGAKNPYKESSYPRKVTVDLKAWMERLTAYHETDCNIRDEFWDLDDRTFAEELYEWSESLTQRVLSSGIGAPYDVPPEADEVGSEP